MKLLSFAAEGRRRFGAVVDGGVADLTDRLPGIGDLHALIERDAFAAAQAALDGASFDYAFDDIAFLPPIAAPEKILCIGVNYMNRNEEYRDGSEAPKYPSI